MIELEENQESTWLKRGQEEPVQEAPAFMQNPITDDDYLDNLIFRVKTRFGLSDYESNILRKINLELRKPTPSSPGMIGERLNLLDELRVQLLNMIYVVTDKNSEFAYSYYEKYNSEFTRLTRMGRPSSQAIDAEINKEPSMHRKRSLLDNFDAFRGMLFGYIKTIDGAKQTCYEKARETR